VATFSLCLLAQAYEHATQLVFKFADLEVTVTLLMEIDKLVQLVESPVFTHLRLQLLEPEQYPYLYKCLYGLLMLLPQSSAFNTLKNRLSCVSSLPSLSALHRTPNSTESKQADKEKEVEAIDFQELLAHFQQVQARHQQHRREAYKLRSSSSESWKDKEDKEEQNGGTNSNRLANASGGGAAAQPSLGFHRSGGLGSLPAPSVSIGTLTQLFHRSLPS
jgi:vacuole morphology and inheritance protein 14